MNKTKLKNYAPQARLDFIQAVTDRAAFYGLTKDAVAQAQESGDFVIISGQPFPKAVAEQRNNLIERIQSSSFEQVMEEIAYTWFNRFVAIRYMELNDYLSHGYRVLSNPDTEISSPEILDQAVHVDLPGLNNEKVVELKMDGTKDEELYRELLIAQCNELHQAMPFLFESIKDCTELLLPDNLLHSDSLIRRLVADIDVEDWQEVEIIGWMYQFYISEKKDEVIGKVVKSEDIPAATQLFTPNWIVKYLVQNSLGAQWMRTYSDSELKSKMEYYIEPAEQTEEVQKQLAEITPDSLNPEELTLLDPACGSGHILVEGYDLLKEIYLERGYRKRDVAQLILKKNLFGLEIDDRAAQLSGFALMMKARNDDRRIFEKEIQPNIVAIQETKKLDVNDIVRAVNAPLTEKDVDSNPASDEFGFMEEVRTPLFVSKSNQSFSEEEKLTVDDLKALLGLFEHGKTFGSLIRIPETLSEKLPAIAGRINTAYRSGNLSAFDAVQKVMPFINQALIMAGKYDAVVANPPYMGGKGMNDELKKFAKVTYPDSKSDLCTMFMDAGLEMCKEIGAMSMINLPSWMFLSSFEKLRDKLICNNTIQSFLHLGRGVFGSDFGTVAFSIFRCNIKDYEAIYRRLFTKHVKVDQQHVKLQRYFDKTFGYFKTSQSDFKKIPGSPIAYWASDSVMDVFDNGIEVGKIGEARKGLVTGNDNLYLKIWFEVSLSCFSMYSTKKDCKWVPINKGGEYRKWYGNNSHVVNWGKDGEELSNHRWENGKQRSSLRNSSYFFKKGITWTYITSARSSFRYYPKGFTFAGVGPGLFVEDNLINTMLAYTNSLPFSMFVNLIGASTITLESGEVEKVPFLMNVCSTKIESNVEELIEYSKLDWDSIETSWDFVRSPLLDSKSSLLVSFTAYWINNKKLTAKVKELEEENEKFFIEAYGLQNELTPDVPEDQITLYANPKYRYGVKLSEEELEKRFKDDTIKELLSYSIGCMMGRYSLDEPGLIYAHRGNEGFDSSKYRTFEADDDGIIPINDFAWFDDDVTERFCKFVETAWNKETLDENLDFVAEAIGRKTSESSREAIRRFFCNDFFKDHLKRYKKRPIYWLFTSGKEKAFQCLVYLHRYNEGTLSRMRTEYLIPLQGKISTRIDTLNSDIEHASSTSEANKIRKDITKLEKQAEELRKYDEKLRHYADMKISLDLDDGVKVNYGKFGDLLAEVKAVTGKKAKS